MKDIEIILQNHPGSLAEMGETLGSVGVSWKEVGHLSTMELALHISWWKDGEKAKLALEEKGIRVAAVHDVLIQKLKQSVPGQLGKICRLMQKAGVNILVQYSDHSNHLILVVDDYEKGKAVVGKWKKEFNKL